jgi:hypothetical protein
MIFASLTLVVNVLIILFMPKRLTRKEIYITWGILAAISLAFDDGIGTALNMYYILKPGVTVRDVFFQATVPPLFGIIFSNFMPVKLTRFIVYLVFWAVGSLLYEWLAIRFHYMTNIRWTLWYSAPVYLLTFLFLRWHLRFIRK